ncbi:MAG: hypothetical protein ACPG49_06820 [Chitinophagales bacterium]
MQDDFYIGWQPKSPRSYAKTMKLFIAMLFVLVPLSAFLLVSSQNKFSTSNFEFGKTTEIEGVLVKKPVPMLKLKGGATFDGKIVYQSILLVAFGKRGAKGDILAMENKEGDLEGKTVRLKGTLIYGDGKTLLELTEGKDALLEVKRGEAFVLNEEEKYGAKTLQGEIIDPKCYFGVMKPGEGKIHRSCAIRCISGGIPPVLRMQDEEGSYSYSLLLGSKGENINQEVLDYVASPIEVSGELSKVDDWLLLRVDFDNSPKLLY